MRGCSCSCRARLRHESGSSRSFAKASIPAAPCCGDIAQSDATRLAAIEGGVPLSRAPLVAHALLALQWLDSAARVRGVQRAGSARRTGQCRMRIAPGSICGCVSARSLEIDPRSSAGGARGRAPRLVAAARDLSRQVTAALREARERAASPRQWSERFDAALAALAVAGRTARSTATRSRRARASRSCSMTSGSSPPPLAPSRAKPPCSWLRELASTNFVSPGERRCARHRLAAAHRSDRAVRRHLGRGAACGRVAAPVQPDPFLPLDAQIAAGVPAATRDGSRGRGARVDGGLAELHAGAGAERAVASGGRAAFAKPAARDVPCAAGPKRARRSIWLPLASPARGAHRDCRGLCGHAVGRGSNRCRPARAASSCRTSVRSALTPSCGSEARPLRCARARRAAGRARHAAARGARETLGACCGAFDGLAGRSPREGLDALIAKCVDEAANEIDGSGSAAADRSGAQRRECRRAARLIRALCDLERRRPPFTVRETELEAHAAAGRRAARRAHRSARRARHRRPRDPRLQERPADRRATGIPSGRRIRSCWRISPPSARRPWRWRRSA